VALVGALNQELLGRYEEEDSFEEPPSAADFEAPTGSFAVAYDGEEPVGCGGFKRLDDAVGELKRMYVVPAARGRGISRLLLGRLEETARQLGYRALRLETGNRQPEALGLYRATGYHVVPCWGAFAADPRSVCLEKSL
jgi:GNAT superfamily N-acetyltransferase